MFICVLAAGSLNVIAQDNVGVIQETNVQQVNEKFTLNDDERKNFSNYYSAESEKAHSFSSEWSFYFQKDGWGAGFIRRYNFSSYASWNIIGVSYMTGWNNPFDYGIVHLPLLGSRLHTPSYHSFRGYFDLNVGYTLLYADGTWFNREMSGKVNSFFKKQNEGHEEKEVQLLSSGTHFAHYFGLDFSVGIQIHKNIALGYNLSFIVNENESDIDHWAKLSFLF